MLTTVKIILAPHFDVVATANDGKAALEAAARTNPDLVLLDIAMPELDGIAVARELKREQTDTEVVFLTAQEDDDFVSAALTVGARGYVYKRRLHSDIVSALNHVLDGRFFVSPHAFDARPTEAMRYHSLRFYPDENIFFGHVSETAFTALVEGGQVFMFLSKIGLDFFRRWLAPKNVSYSKFIQTGHLCTFSVENVLRFLMMEREHDSAFLHSIGRGQFLAFGEDTRPFVIENPWPDPAPFECFFSRHLEGAANRAAQLGSKVTIISDLTATLLGYGYGHEVVGRVERIWNGLIPSRSCIVYCGCPVTHLYSKETREALARICREHAQVIAIDHSRAAS